MDWILSLFSSAWQRVFSWDENLYEIVGLTLLVSLSALLIATFLAIPFAAWLSLGQGVVRRGCIVLVHVFMGLPPVVAGLLVYMLLSRQGPLGGWGLLFSPWAMILAQVLLIFPIVCGISQQVFVRRRQYLSDLFFSLNLPLTKQLGTIIYESRSDILGAVVTGLGRGLAEVGAVMIVGGNILHHTRTITTAIALETSKGELEIAVSLGVILLMISLLLNVLLLMLNRHLEQYRVVS